MSMEHRCPVSVSGLRAQECGALIYWVAVKKLNPSHYIDLRNMLINEYMGGCQNYGPFFGYPKY